MQSTDPAPETLNNLKEILRRDLKLGPDVPIPDDMPFFGSAVDLDSLDMLLLVTHIEKTFGVKIPSQAIGRSVFENVKTLARFVEANAAGANGKAAAPAGPAPDPLRLLPHAEPFRFVSSIRSLEPGVKGEGIWSVSGSEAWLAGHFPGHPIVPGVLMAEALAQFSGLVGVGAAARAPNTTPGATKLAHIDIRFDQPVIPPAEIILESRLLRMVGPLKMFEVGARVGGVVVCRGTLALHGSDEPGGGNRPA